MVWDLLWLNSRGSAECRISALWKQIPGRPCGSCHTHWPAAWLRFQPAAQNSSITVRDLKAKEYNWRKTARHASTVLQTQKPSLLLLHSLFCGIVQPSLGTCQGCFLGNRLSCSQHPLKWFEEQQTERCHVAKAGCTWVTAEVQTEPPQSVNPCQASRSWHRVTDCWVGAGV